MDKFRDFSLRLSEFCEKNKYTLIADELDFVILEDSKGFRFHCSGESLHWTMISEGII